MISLLGFRTLLLLEHAQAFLALVGRALWSLFERILLLRFRFGETVDLVYSMGVKSLPVMLFSLTFTGLILTLEFSFHMKLVLRQDSLVPSFSTLLMIREIGPVVTCLLLASNLGAGMATELATMKTTDQIDALRLMGIDPIEFLTVPRWVACVISAVSISVISVGVAILAGAFLSTLYLQASFWEYIQSMFLFSKFEDFRWLFVKSAVFGSIIPLVASYHGFQARYGASGVGRAATNSVVHSTATIIVADFVLTYWLHRL